MSDVEIKEGGSTKMIYQGPIFRTEQEILDGLEKCDADRISLVLSALYYTSTEFAGDILIKEFEQLVENFKNYDKNLKEYLKNLFGTFYGMHNTDYRVDDSIFLLKKYLGLLEIYIPENAELIGHTLYEINDLYLGKFLGKPKIDRLEFDILIGLAEENLSPHDRLDLVSSAVYFKDVEFAGDVLIAEFSKAKYNEKIYFTYLFEKFYQKNNTLYKIDDSIELWKNYLIEAPEHRETIINEIGFFEEYIIDYWEENSKNMLNN